MYKIPFQVKGAIVKQTMRAGKASDGINPALYKVFGRKGYAMPVAEWPTH
jgi:hypothetical protein